MNSEEVSIREVLNSLQERLNTQLKKACIYPDLLDACLPTIQGIKILQKLKSEGAKIHLVERPTSISHHIHAIEEEYISTYNLCRRLNLEVYCLNGDVYALTDIIYRGNIVVVYLGERRPFIRFSSDPFIMSRQEFLSLYNEIREYCRVVGYPLKYIPKDEIEKHDEFIIRSYNTSLPKIRLKTILNIEDFAEKYYYVQVSVSGEETEGRKEKMLVAAVEKLIEGGVKLSQSSCHQHFWTVYEVDAQVLEQLIGLPIADVAERVMVVKDNDGVLEAHDVDISTPTNYLHVLRVLEERGISASLVAVWPSYKNQVKLPKPLGIRLHKVYADGWLYSIVIFPKSKNLPPIKTAKIIRTPKKITFMSRLNRNYHVDLDGSIRYRWVIGDGVEC